MTRDSEVGGDLSSHIYGGNMWSLFNLANIPLFHSLKKNVLGLIFVTTLKLLTKKFRYCRQCNFSFCEKNVWICMALLMVKIFRVWWKNDWDSHDIIWKCIPFRLIQLRLMLIVVSWNIGPKNPKSISYPIFWFFYLIQFQLI